MKTVSSSTRQFMAGSFSSTPTGSSGKKIRKPYTITKSRESWNVEEHDKFLEALHLFGRDWKKIEDYVGSKTVIQIRSHAQKYFLKIQKKGTIAHVPPPRPKRKIAPPHPQKAIKNASMVHPSTLTCVAPGLSLWDDSAMLMNTAPNGSISSQDEYTFLHAFEDSADIASEGVVSLGNGSFSCRGSSSIILPNYDMLKQRSLLHGVPDFAEVYSFIGSVFDPDTKGHLQQLKQMDPISIKTALILMRNLTVNLSTPGFEPIGNVLSANNVNAKIGGT